MKNWKDIHKNFTEELQKKWEEKDFTAEQTKEWIDARLKVGDAEYAQKLLPWDWTVEKNKIALQDFEWELAILKTLSHSHVVQVMGSYTDTKFVDILMSPITDCNLKEFLQQNSLWMPIHSLNILWMSCLWIV